MKQLNYTLLTIMLVVFGMVGMNAQDITHADGSFTVTQGTTVNYYDNGGPDCDGTGGEYLVDSDATAVICPDVAGSVITIEFLDVDVEIRTTDPCWDYINVYDGDSDAATQLFSGCGEEGFAACTGFPGDGGDGGNIEGGVNDIDGSNAPSPVNNVFTSSAPNGCLTVNFTSDGSVQEGGWVATASASAVGGGPTCDDGIQNGDEEGVDCGGSSCPPCDMEDEQICYDLTLTFDNFPEETSWEITDLGGGVIFAEDFYDLEPDGSTLVEDFCLDPGCYEFTIFDGFGDGMCCTFGPGSYELEDDDGNVVAAGGEFGDDETTFFCTPPPADCVAPTATATVNSYCESGVFWVLVNLSDLGGATTVVIANTSENVPALENVFFPRTYYLGPFRIGEPVSIYIYDTESFACNVFLSGLSDSCGESIVDGGTDGTSFGVFPNPTTGEVNLNVAQYIGKDAQVSIYNAMGQLIEQRQLRDIQTATERFDLSAQQSGMYMINLNVKGAVHTERVMLNNVRP